MDASQPNPASIPGRSNIRLSSIWRALVEPAGSIRDAARRRKARLLSIFLLCLFLLFLGINVAYLITIPGYRVLAADLIGYGVLLLTYLISRTRFTGIAVVILLIMFPLNVFSNVLDGTSLNLAATLSFLIPSYILASIFLNPLWTGIYGYGINLLLLLLPVLVPQDVPKFNEVLGPLSAGVVTVTLSIIAMIHRDQIERDRRAELKRDYNSTLAGWSPSAPCAS